jgi:predicted transcriptional regulator
METQNITLSLPKDILLKVKHIAVRRNVSVSSLLTQALETLVQQEDAYAQAKRRHLQWLEQGADLGTGGQIETQRDDLHERR